MFDLDQNPEFGPVVESAGQHNHAPPTKIGENLLLIPSQSYFTVVNYKEKKIVSQVRHGPQMEQNPKAKIVNIGDQVFWTCNDSLYVLTRSEEDPERIQSFQKFNLLDYIPDDQGLLLRKDYSLVKLKSGNLLYVGARSGGKTLRGVAIEFSPITLEGINSCSMGEEKAGYTTETIDFKEFYHLDQDLLVSIIAKKGTTEEGSDITFGLGLWDKELNLLDQNFDHTLGDFKSIQTVDHQYVTVRGAGKDYFLFRINPESRRIVPAKHLSIKAQEISNIEKQEEDPKEFKLEVKSIQGNQKLLLKFNSQLELLSWTSNYRENFEDR